MTQSTDEVKEPGPDASKETWRAWARARRSRVGAVAAGQVVDGLAAWLAGIAPTTVVAYRAMTGEVSLDALVAADRHHRWATTRTPTEGDLTVHHWNGPTERHRYGFDQPTADVPAIAPGSIGVVLVPGLLFDRRGGRLGHGKGYYDRLLAALPGAVTVGVTLDALIVRALPTRPHDVPMAWLASESGVRRVEAS